MSKKPRDDDDDDDELSRSRAERIVNWFIVLTVILVLVAVFGPIVPGAGPRL